MTHREKIRQKWLAEYRAYETSGLSPKDFCAERRLSYWSFKGWQHRFQKERGSETFRELAVVPAAEASYSVVLRSGRELKLSGGFSPARVRQLVEVLEAC